MKSKNLVPLVGAGIAAGLGVLAYNKFAHAEESPAPPSPLPPGPSPAPKPAGAPSGGAVLQAPPPPPVLRPGEIDFNVPVAGYATIATKTDPLALRDKPSTTGNVLGRMAKGTTGIVLDRTPTSGWYHLNYNGMVGWASGDYLLITDGPPVAGMALSPSPMSPAQGSVELVSADDHSFRPGFPYLLMVQTGQDGDNLAKYMGEDGWDLQDHPQWMSTNSFQVAAIATTRIHTNSIGIYHIVDSAAV